VNSKTSGEVGVRGRQRAVLALVLVAWVLVGTVNSRTAVEDPGQPLWPLDLSERFLTSNFMEFRDGRFHAGLDLKTRSRTGFPVRAAEDGFVSRLNVATGGYGRAVYLHGDSGRTYVYAHLERFNDALQQLVRDEQQRRQRFAVNLYLPENSVRLERGGIVGISGQSGTSGPHLHFEVRDGRQRPLNPESCGFAVPDTFTPRIIRIRALPVTPESRVAGGLVSVIVEATAGLTGSLPALTIEGPVAFSALVQDAADIRGHRLEPYRLTVTVNDREVFLTQNDEFAFAENSEQRLEWLRVDGVRERWLHRAEPNRLPGRQGGFWSADTGLLAPGRHTVTVVAEDRSGNRSRLSWPLLVSSSDAAPATEPAAGWRAAPLGLEVPVTAPGEGSWRLTPFLLLAPGQKRAYAVGDTLPALLSAATTRGVRQRQLRRELGDPVLMPTTLLVVPATVNATHEPALRDLGLVALGPAAWYLAGDWPITTAVEVAMPVASTASEFRPDVGIYRFDGRGRWMFVDYPQRGSPTDSVCTFPLSQPGLHALLRDVGDPQLGEVRRTVVLQERASRDYYGVTLPRWPTVDIPLFDAGSGIAPATILAWLDGEPVVPEPDLPRDRLLVELPDSLPPGTHVLGLEVADWAERYTDRVVRIECRPVGREDLDN